MGTYSRRVFATYIACITNGRAVFAVGLRLITVSRSIGACLSFGTHCGTIIAPNNSISPYYSCILIPRLCICANGY